MERFLVRWLESFGRYTSVKSQLIVRAARRVKSVCARIVQPEGSGFPSKRTRARRVEYPLARMLIYLVANCHFSYGRSAPSLKGSLIAV